MLYTYPKPVKVGLANTLSFKTRECGGSSFRVMKDEGERGLWNLPSQLRKAPKARHVPGEALFGDPERPLNKAVKVKPELCWRPQSVGNAPTMGWLPRRAAPREWNQLKRRAAVSRAGRMELSWATDLRHGSYRIRILLCWVSVFLWFSIFSLCPNLSILEW